MSTSTALPEGLRTVAVVRSPISEPRYIEWAEVESTLEVDAQWHDALHDIEGYSHIVVVFWLHDAMMYKLRHVPQGKYDDVPEVGMFACRCPYRPNPIAISTVVLLGREGTRLRVKGLDAIDGTAVLDIKPYTPQVDAPKGEVRVPDWTCKLVY